MASGLCNLTTWSGSSRGSPSAILQSSNFGMEVVLRIVPFYVDKDGNEIITFAFAPVGAQNSEES